MTTKTTSVKEEQKIKWLLKLKDGKTVIGIGVTADDVAAEKGIDKADIYYSRDVSKESQLSVSSRLYFVDRGLPMPNATGVSSRRYAQLKKTAEVILDKVGASAPAFVGIIKEERCKGIDEHLAVAFILGELTALQNTNLNN